MAEVIAVAALNKYVKSLLESDPALVDLAIRGEISNFNKHYKTGHCYFSIKDGTASVSAVMFRSDAGRLAFTPENGMGVVARCRVSLYERDGRFQVYVQELFPDGVGAAQMAFEQLKARLQAEGLFEQLHKKPIPAYPRCVGLVTSKTGAALQDILKVAARRCPDIHFLLAPVTVQGAAAAPEIARAIQRLDESGRCDSIIVARGGGSAEDLWVFNAEGIARAVFACKTPVVSAIGHEIDFTILDFVADLRAPTPSAAAEMALPDLVHSCETIMNIYNKIADNMHTRLDSCYNTIKAAQNHVLLQKTANLPLELQEKIREYSVTLQTAATRNVRMAQQRLQAAAALAESLNPYGVLARGYTITRCEGRAVRSVTKVKPDDLLEIQLTDGHIDCTVTDVRKEETIA